jgi:hypothetical protein
MYFLAWNNMGHIIRYNICRAGFCNQEVWVFFPLERKITKEETRTMGYYVFIYVKGTVLLIKLILT